MPNGRKYMAKEECPVKVGNEYGKWVVIAEVEDDPLRVVAMCECGSQKKLRRQVLKDGLTRKCSKCAKEEMTSIGFMTIEAKKKLASKYPPCDPEKEQAMIAEYLKTHKPTKC